MRYQRFYIFTWVIGICLISHSAMATEAVELVNGDIVHGQVLSLDGNVLRLRSESFGDLSIDRAKVATIRLANRPAKSANQPLLTPETREAPSILDRVPSGHDVLKELQAAGGVTSEDLQGLQQKFPMLAAPEVSNYLNEQLSGLITGRIDLLDIRQQAVKAVDQIKDLQKDLGPQANALNGYLSILEGFIDETAPPPEDEKATDKPVPNRR